jgi:hypothetical protein
LRRPERSPFRFNPMPSTTQLASDNFHRADANPISGNWSPFVATPGLVFCIVSNQAEPAADSALSIGGNFYNGISWPNDQYSEVTVGTSASGAASDAFLVLVRTSATGNCYALVFACEGATTCVIQKYIAGAVTNLATFSFTATTGDVVRLSVQGSNLVVYKNGAQIGTATDSSITSGSPGMGFYFVNTAFSNATLSLWAGGTFVAPEGEGNMPQSIVTGDTFISSPATIVFGTLRPWTGTSGPRISR